MTGSKPLVLLRFLTCRTSLVSGGKIRNREYFDRTSDWLYIQTYFGYRQARR
jgi:hypothetical protein